MKVDGVCAKRVLHPELGGEFVHHSNWMPSSQTTNGSPPQESKPSENRSMDFGSLPSVDQPASPRSGIARRSQPSRASLSAGEVASSFFGLMR